MVHVWTVLHVLTHLSLLKTLNSFSSFISSSRLTPFSKPPLLIVLVVAYSLFYNQKTEQKTVSGVGQQYSASALVFPCTIILHLWVFMALPCPSWYNIQLTYTPSLG